MVKTLIAECKEIIRELVGNETLYFDSSIDVKLSPHTEPVAIWGTCVSPKGTNLYLMDRDENWHKAEDTDENISAIVSSLYQRLKLLKIRYNLHS